MAQQETEDNSFAEVVLLPEGKLRTNETWSTKSEISLRIGDYSISVPDDFNPTTHSRTGKGSAETMIQRIADSAEHIYLALGYTDFRRQITGLTAMVALPPLCLLALRISERRLFFTPFCIPPITLIIIINP